MGIFKQYAKFYDALYKDKDYGGECDFLEEAFELFPDRKVKTVLDLGCGTASHSMVLSGRGYDVTGVDASFEMLKIAKQKIKKAKLKIKLYEASIQSAKIKKKFDTVISMFDVMSYQNSKTSLKECFLNAKNHLQKGGVFVFDAWHAPAVLKRKPKERSKTVYLSADDKIVRRSTCEIDAAKRIVKVKFNTKKYHKGRLLETNNELHRMKYFFADELKSLLRSCGLTVEKICPFRRIKSRISESDWKIAFICTRSPE